MHSDKEADPGTRLVERILGAIARGVVRRPGRILVACACLAVVAGVTAALGLELKTKQNDLVSNDLPYNQRYLRFLESFGDLEFLYVIILVEGQPELAARVADRIAEEVGQLEEHVQAVHYRLPADAFGNRVLLRPDVPTETLRQLGQDVAASGEVLAGLAKVDGFNPLFRFFGQLLEPRNLVGNRRLAESGAELLDATLDGLTAAARGVEPVPLKTSIEERVWKTADHPRNRGYLFTENGELAFVEILPTKNYETLEVIRAPLRAIREALDRVRADPDLQGVTFGLTGRPVLHADEMETTNRDMVRATALALFSVLVLFVLVFRRLRRPLLAGVTLVFGIVLTFGFVAVSIGYLTLLSIVFAAMLVGLGIDFSIHLLSRYQEELRSTHDVEGSIIRTLTSTGVGIWTGGVTTAAAFYSTLLVNFQGLRELGFVAGTGVLICVAATLIFLPALLVVTDRRLRTKRILEPPAEVRMPFLTTAARFPRTVVVVLSILTAVGLFGSPLVPVFSFNLLELQPVGLESVEFERHFMERSDRSTWFAAFLLDSLEEVDATIARFDRPGSEGVVGIVESVRDHVATDQEARQQALAPAHAALAAVEIRTASEAVDVPALARTLGSLVERLGVLRRLAEMGPGRVGAEELEMLERKVAELTALLEADPTTAGTRLGPYQTRWFGELRGIKAELQSLLAPSALTPDSLPEAIRHRFLSEDGAVHLLYVYPEKDIWDETNMKEFVDTVVAVDPEVTGTPIQVYESVQLMQRGFLRAALYSVIIVFVLLVLDLRSVKQAAWIMLPLAAGIVWLFELMPRFSLNFNLANFFALPVLIGVGVDGGVHILHRFRETGSVREVLRTTGSAVTLSFLTTILGFGALCVAGHRGVASLGLLMVLGCATLLVSTTLLLPACLKLLGRSGTRTGDQSGGERSP